MRKIENAIIYFLLTLAVCLAIFDIYHHIQNNIDIKQNNIEYQKAQQKYNEYIEQNKLIFEQQQNCRKERCQLYDGINDYNRVIATGLYWTGTDYYCVWANDRKLEDIEKTDRHEYCHYLVDNDYNHFCKGE